MICRLCQRLDLSGKTQGRHRKKRSQVQATC